MHIGETIARLRREAGLTQEQLGALVSVSAQAVSKWENGGMPDADLLPAIADALHVSIDTVFGRDNLKNADIEAIFYDWYTRIAEEKRQDALFRLLLLALSSPVKPNHEGQTDEADALMNLPYKSSNGYYFENGERIPAWLRAQFLDEYGMRLSIPAEDCPLFLVLPEPEDGYRRNLLEPKAYESFFAALSHAGSMELLYFLYSEPSQYYSAAALAKACGLEEDGVMPVLNALCEIKLIAERSVVGLDGTHRVYTLNENPGFVPFLLFARWMLAGPGYIWSWTTRANPIFRKDGREA